MCYALDAIRPCVLCLFSFLFSLPFCYYFLLLLLFVEDHRWVIDMHSVLRISCIFPLFFSLSPSSTFLFCSSLIEVMLLDFAAAVADTTKHTAFHSSYSSILFLLPFLVLLLFLYLFLFLPFLFSSLFIACTLLCIFVFFLLVSSIVSLCCSTYHRLNIPFLFLFILKKREKY